MFYLPMPTTDDEILEKYTNTLFSPNRKQNMDDETDNHVVHLVHLLQNIWPWDMRLVNAPYCM